VSEGEGIRAEGLVSPEDLAALDAVGPVDVLVGVPTLNPGPSATAVLERLATGIAREFPTEKAVLLVAAAGSQDSSWEAVRAWRDAASLPVTLPCVRLPGPPERGRALLGVLAIARRLRFRAAAVVDADLTSASPEWVERLVSPVLHGEADYVTPAYTLAASEGTLTTNLLAPLTRALFGKRIQQVIGGCAGLSAALVSRFLDTPADPVDATPYGAEMRLAIEALASDRPVAETHLGAKRVEPRAAVDLPTTVAASVEPLFDLMERYRAVWPTITGSRPVPQRGGSPGPPVAPGEPDIGRMVRAFRLGLKDLLPVWEQIMPEETLSQLYPLGVLAADEFEFPPRVWTRVVSDFALAHQVRRLPRKQLLRALTPLYLGRVAGFLRETEEAPPARIAGRLEFLAKAFEGEKEYLRARWR
jgi:glucosylglycerate synthase